MAYKAKQRGKDRISTVIKNVIRNNHPKISVRKNKLRKITNSLFQDYTKQSFSGLQTLKKDSRESFSRLLSPPSLSLTRCTRKPAVYRSECLTLFLRLV